MIRSVRRYWKVVDEDVKMTQVDDVATAIDGSTPIQSINGEKTNPPPMPTRPAKQPVKKDILIYAPACRRVQPSLATSFRV
mmetsp:Transcript_119060/g.205998  ORF Transcript_119060/g.205998 Transcript_119060/m.205998 type:complete len:81 (-) Transcript_119060:1334-1576(-)